MLLPRPVAAVRASLWETVEHPMIACVLIILALAVCAPMLYRLAGRATGWILGLAAACVTAALAAKLLGLPAGETLVESFDWAPTLGLSFSLLGDGLSLLFAIIIAGVGSLIVIYAGGYLRDHRQLGAFYLYILLFMASMLGVVLSDNVVLLFVFWEMTSLSSYLLIGFDHERPAARAAALQALLVTGMGGLALLAGLVLLGQAGGTMQLSELLLRGDAIRGHALYMPILVLVLLGATTKSAQFPFHFWLPGAMEAPSPVSAYLHSATMVKAGVFLLARLSPVLGGTAAWHGSLVTIGCVTMLLGAAMSLSADGLKKILAYSTVSVLGTLTMLLGVGTTAAVQAAVVYLMAHVLYKAALFLLAGSVSHATGTYEADALGGLRRAMPWSAAAAALAALSMAGVVPMLGFVGKEALYGAGWGLEVPGVLLAVAVVAAHIMLFVVAFRVGVRPFVGPLRPTPHVPHEVPLSLRLGPLVAGVAGLAGGVLIGPVGRVMATPAAGAALGRQDGLVPLTLWHGLTPALGLSVLTLACGIGLIAIRGRVLAFLAPLSALGRFGPAAWYEAALRGLTAVAKGQTRILQSGYLRSYLLITLMTCVGLVAAAMVRGAALPRLPGMMDARVYEIVIALLIVAATITSVRSRTRLGAVASLGVVGYGVALMYVFYGAPDLAMTQFLIETLMVVLLVLVLYHLPPFTIFSGRASRLRDAVVAGAFGLMMTTLVLAAGALQSHPRISSYFSEHSLPDAHGRNVVNVILVDFRAMDTLGEITVLAVAAMGVFALLKLRRRKEDRR